MVLVKQESSTVYFLNAPYPLCAFKNGLHHKRGQTKTSTWDSVSVSEYKIFMTPGARAIFLHSNVLYNDKFVTGGDNKNWGGGTKPNRSNYFIIN